MKITKICYETRAQVSPSFFLNIRSRMDFVPCVINLQYCPKNRRVCVTYDQELCTCQEITQIMREEDV